jgi:hypothetical protein
MCQPVDNVDSSINRVNFATSSGVTGHRPCYGNGEYRDNECNMLSTYVFIVSDDRVVNHSCVSKCVSFKINLGCIAN